MLTSLIPAPYRLLAWAALSLAMISFGWVKGAAHVQGKWDSAIAKQSLHVANIRQRQAEATVQVVTKYVDRIKIVRETGATIIKEVPVYVSAEADTACVLPRGFVRLHDAAAAGRLADLPGAADATPSGITLSTVAGTVADNYERCHENAEQLTALQAWIREVRPSAVDHYHRH